MYYIKTTMGVLVVVHVLHLYPQSPASGDLICLVTRSKNQPLSPNHVLVKHTAAYNGDFTNHRLLKSDIVYILA
jgi:hypothetical protein